MISEWSAILQKDSPHEVDPASMLLQSTETGFGGLPGELYTDSHPLSDRIDFIIGANGYFLIQTDEVLRFDFYETILSATIAGDDHR